MNALDKLIEARDILITQAREDYERYLILLREKPTIAIYQKNEHYISKLNELIGELSKEVLK
jgi:hypothetical protein